MALLEAENARLKEDLRATEPRNRKKVKEPPNGKFAKIGDIVTAEEASQKPPKRRLRRSPQSGGESPHA